MDRELNTQNTVKRQELLKRLRESAELFALMSACTKAPYVVCDQETFDDEVMIFFQEDEAKEMAKKLIQEKIPVGVTRVENQHLLLFYTSLYTMGINAMLIQDGGQKERVQLEEFVKRNQPKEEGKVWVENPALHLTALYFMQEFRRPSAGKDNGKLQELQEEITVNFGKGRYLTALENEGNGVAVIKLKNGDSYQAVFTDILEFQRFNREKKMRPAMVEAAKLPQLLPPETKGVILNPMGVNMPLVITRPVKPAPEKQES